MVRHLVLLISALVLMASASQTQAGSHEAAGDEEVKMRGIGWILLRSHEPKKLAEFYFALGFKEWASSERIIGLHAGGGAAFEIGYLDEGSPNNPPRTTRTQVSAAAIIGVNNADMVAERAREAGAMFIESRHTPETRMYYIADPEGNVIGFAEDGPMWGQFGELERLGIEPVNPEQ